jgi:uncharacterized membrane protein YgaE (UPF0421/DUF939 family)
LATALATGAKGPVRVALDQLRRYGIGERVVKSGLAAGLAWLIATRIHANPVPVLAPITALFTIQFTLARSVVGSIQRFLGVGAGIATALLLNRVIGLQWWTVGLIVVVSLVAGFRIFRLEAAGVEQMSVSALLVMIAGAGGNIVSVAGYHALDTVIGTAVGLAANALVAPPSHVDRGKAAVAALGADLATLLRDQAAELRAGLSLDHADELLGRARQIASAFNEVQLALEHADESLRYNLAGRRQRRMATRLRHLGRTLEHAAVQTRVVCRAARDAVSHAEESRAHPWWLAPGLLGAPLADHLVALAGLLDHVIDECGRETTAEVEDEPVALTAQTRQAVFDALAANVEVMLQGGWILAGEILSLTDQMVADIRHALAELRA